MAFPAVLFLCACAWLTLHSSASARQATPTAGAVIGRVTDRSGAVLPAATVEIRGASLMGVRTTTSGPDGSYRFTALPPGEYAIAFTRAGFRTVRREALRIRAGVTVTIDAELDVAALQDTVVVERGTPVIDQQSTEIRAAFDARELSDLPGSRSLFAILAATPALHVARFEVGGSSGDAGSPYGVYGTTGANRPMVEGIVVSGIFPSGFMLNYGSFEDVSIGIAAHGAEGSLPGVHVQVVTKSGGNRYRGSLYADYEDRDWQAFNIDRQQIERGAAGGERLSPRDANRLWRYHDVNADIGGYARKDVVWWYFSFRDQETSQRLVNLPEKPLRLHSTNYDAKLTGRPNANNSLVAFGQVGRSRQPDRLESFGPVGGTLTAATAFFESDGATVDQLGWGWIGKGEWTSVIDDRTLLELRVGAYGTTRTQRPNGTAPRFEDLGTLIVRGGNRHWQERIRRPQVLGSIGLARRGWLGSHDIRLGGEIIQSTAEEIWRAGYAGDIVHVLRNERPAEVYLLETPSSSKAGLRLWGAYATDAWIMSQRVTASLGVRFDRYRVFLPEQVHPAGRFNPTAQTFAAVGDVITRNTAAPRLGLVIDLSGRGTTVAKVNYGLYWYPAGTEVGASANPNSNLWWRRYSWLDRNDNGFWDAAEEGQLLGRRGGVASESIDPRLRLPYMQEIALSVERQLASTVGLRAGLIWRGERQHYSRQNTNRPFGAFTVPLVVRDPGPDGSLGTFDDGRGIRAYDLAPGLLSQPPINIVRNVPRADSHYWSCDITATRRFVGRWSLSAGFEHTWSRDQAGAYFGQSVRNNVLPLTPNDLINAGPDGRYEFRTWSAKIHGTFEAPWGVRVSPLLRHQSGQPFGRTFSTTLGYGSVRILAEPIDTRRMDNVTLLDVRVEKSVRLGAGRRVAGFVDVFNVLNANPEQNASWSSGSFLRPLTIVPPRIARIGATLEW